MLITFKYVIYKPVYIIRDLITFKNEYKYNISLFE